MNRYTSIEAERLHNLGRPFHWLKLFYQPGRAFWNRYVRHRGFRDGLAGLIVCVLMGVYWQVAYIKLWEIYDRERRQDTGIKE
jgi:hypothetical protein